MDVSLVKNETLEKIYNIKMQYSVIEAEVNVELQKLSTTVKMPGFRPGKVPFSFVKKKYYEPMFEDVFNKKASKIVQDILKKNSYRTIQSPNIHDVVTDPNKGIDFNVKFLLFPEIEEIDYSTIKLERPVIDVTDEDVEKSLGDLVKSFAEYNLIKRPAQSGDKVTIDFEGSIDGKEFEGGKAADQDLILGSGAFIHGFEDQLIGSKAKDKVLVKVRFPKGYHAKDFADKEAEFKVVVKSVFEPKYPKVDIDLATKLQCKDVDELKSMIRKRISNVFDKDLMSIQKLHLFDALEEKLNFDVPSSMFESEYKIVTKQMGSGDKDAKIDDEESKKIALRRVRIGLLIANYFDKNNMQLSEKDFQNAIIEQAQMFGADPNVVFNFYNKNPQALEGLRGTIMENKVVEVLLKDKVSFKEKKYSLEGIKKFITKENASE
jgi:trigger factor